VHHNAQYHASAKAMLNMLSTKVRVLNAALAQAFALLTLQNKLDIKQLQDTY
jgi:hypothetical protein